ncbi:uncharacterized protein LOC134821411 [Bolinopsis microptera]|uniref:uncharacterized protein LOC134821411 n=1 Tax=Bolinopsis microptera TaxID=2820187 RepID=UPI0030799C50
MTPSITAIETTDGQEGSVYCKYTVESSDLNRGEGGQLVVRTTTADFAAEDGDEVTMINESMFLMDKEESEEMDCGDGNTFAWFVNGVKNSDSTTQTYKFEHDGVDTIIQCIKSSEDETLKTNTIWNVFTVTEVKEVDPTETDIDVTHEKSTTFNCEIVSDTESFPAPLRMWFWLDDTDGAEEELKKVTAADPPTYEQTITYSDNGNFKCYQENGIGSKSLVKNYKTVYIVDTKVDYLTPNPRYWYEYIESVPEVYYVKKDTFNISCGITKEARYKIWWKLGEEYFHLDETDDVFKKLNPGASDDDKWADSLDIEDTDGWSIIKQDDDASLGHLTKQDFAIENYKSDMADAIEMSDPVVCFLIDTDTMTTVADLKGVETGEKEETFKKLTVRVFDKITKPIVKGPLNQIQSEKIGKPITMNCKTNGIPPSFIYFMFTNNKTEGTNITEELLKEDKAVQFTRYRIERVTDILTTLTITAPNEEDEGKFTCYAINRQTTEDSPEAGPDADVYIEEPCSEGAQFCFKNFSTPIIKYLWAFVLAFGVLKSIL